MHYTTMLKKVICLDLEYCIIYNANTHINWSNQMNCKMLFKLFKKVEISCGLLLMTFIFPSIVHSNSQFCSSKPLLETLKMHGGIDYLHCFPEEPFEFTKLSVVDDHYLHPYKGVFENTYILTIPQGEVFGKDGWVLINDTLINELIWQNVFPSKQALQKAKENKTVSIPGRVAVIAQSGYTYYYHWIAEVLGRLALLEMRAIDYDFLYVPLGRPFMKETLQLFGVDPSKIIEASDDLVFTADQLIVPSLVARVRTEGCPRLVHYLPKHILFYIKNKLLSAVEKEPQEHSFCKKVFLSRKDAVARKMLNEDDVFALFEAQGFKRYVLSEMSIVDQILLFKNAEIIVGALGSNLTNVIFCNSKVRIFDIFQARRDCTINYLCQNLGLSYQCVKTTDFIDQNDGQFDTVVPLDIIKNLISDL